MHISVNKNYELRIGLFPAGFDEDGVLFCNQNFSDYPITVPKGRFDPRNIKPQWMLLAYKKQAKASSGLQGYEPLKALNEDIRSCWCSERNSPGEWYELDLGDIYTVHAIQINFADVQVPKMVFDKKDYGGEFVVSRHIDIKSRLKTRYLIEGSVNGKSWFVLKDSIDTKTDLPHDYIEFLNGKQLRYILVTAFELPYSKKFALSGLRVFGKGNGEKPLQTLAKAKRISELDAAISWNYVKGGQGYNIRYGVAPG